MGKSQNELARTATHAKARVRGVLTDAKPSLTAGDWIFILAMLALCLFFLFLPVAAFLIARRVMRRRREFREIAGDLPAFLDRAALTVAYPLMVNTALLRPGGGSAPGLFLVSPDSATGHDAQFNIDLVESISLPESPPMTEANEAWCVDIFRDETFTPMRLRKVPTTIAAGRDVYAADLAIDCKLLDGHAISRDKPSLPCLFDETTGMCLILPGWTHGDAPPTPAERETLLMALLLQQHLRRRAG